MLPNLMEFFEPSDFLDDPYGWLTNQISHICLGLFLAFAFSALGFLLFDEFPYRSNMLIAIFVGYVAFELAVQGWRKTDTLEDVLFVVGYGASAALATFEEISAGSSHLTVDIMHLSIFIVIAFIHLAVGYRWRVKYLSD